VRYALVFLVACAHGSTTTTPARPDTTVVDEIKAAETAEKARQHDVARAHYEAAIKAAHDPASVDLAHRSFAGTLISWGEIPEAKIHLEAAVAAKPDDAGSWHDLGLVLNALGDKEHAVSSLEKARDLRPDDPRPRIALAALRWKLGDRPGATLEYKALLGLDLPTPVREKVEWAIKVLENNGIPAPPPRS
jgi:Flp pilus assembly protein TadD